MKHLEFLFALLGLSIWSPASLALPIVSLTVTPAIISNTYPGTVSVMVAGLTNFQPVKVQTFLDLNGNGQVDPGEPLLDVFTIQESGVTTIGGITNLNVPYDSNPATDAITTSLNFAPPLPLENIVGQKIYRVISNPSGAFKPMTANMMVTDAILGQSASGVVYSNGIAPLPYALVVAVTATNQNYVAATVADAGGNYSLQLSPGAYVLLPAMPGYFTDQNLAPSVAMTSGVSVTNNLTLTNGSVTISGSVLEAGVTNTLGAVFLQAQSGSLMGIAFTDTNGNYTVGATSNNWKLKIPAERMARRGYLVPQGTALTVSAALGSVTNANVSLYRGNALFYGQLTIANIPMANVSLEANDSGQLFSGKGFTDTNGNYAVAALANTNALPAGTTWLCNVSAGAQVGLLNNYVFNSSENIQLISNQVVAQNFVGLPVASTISGRLLNNQGLPVVGVSVGASAAINGLEYVSEYVDTGTNGDFTFGVADGEWYVNANCCGSDGLQEQGYYETNSTPVSVPPGNPVVNLTVYPANQPQVGQPLYLPNSQFDFNLYGANGYNYTVQASSNLASSNWTTVSIISNFPGSPYLMQDFHATNADRFYRVFQGP